MIYMDGLLVTRSTYTHGTGFAAAATGLTIGKVSSTFKGYLQEVALYNTALSPQRVWTHYQTGIRP